jgi:hypothetical protein
MSIPRQQFIQPVDLVIVDAVEDVSEIGLWVSKSVRPQDRSVLRQTLTLDSGYGTIQNILK